MPHTCRNCKRTFSTELELELHLDTCSAGQLFCDECGGAFTEGAATGDGGAYRSPKEGGERNRNRDDTPQVTDARGPKQETSPNDYCSLSPV